MSMKRRDFLKAAATGLAAAAGPSIFVRDAHAADKLDFGAVRSV